MNRLALIIFLLPTLLLSRTLEVCDGCEFSNLNEAVAVVEAGDTILLEGDFNGGMAYSELKGNSDNWIHIIGKDGTVINGGNTAIQFSDCEYLHLKNIIFKEQVLNGVNIDDAGSFDTPTHHIKIESCTFRDMQNTGNNDLLKLSGLDDFEIINCTFENGSPGGSGIDMVGCHEGKIVNNSFTNMGSNSIQAKGGTADIEIARNWFEDGGLRGVNIGGSTGFAYFRPQDAEYESARISVYANVFNRGNAPVAFVGTVDSEVYNNTILGPERWVFRILQESVDPERFIECGDNSFFNNLVIVTNDLHRAVNIGPNTRPETFELRNNLWANSDNINWVPNLPVEEQNSILNTDPKLTINEDLDIIPGSNSPAISAGSDHKYPIYDHDSVRYHSPPTIGAFEGDPITSVLNYRDNKLEYEIIGNRIILNSEETYSEYRIYDIQGRLLDNGEFVGGEVNLKFIGNRTLFVIIKNNSKSYLIKTIKEK